MQLPARRQIEAVDGCAQTETSPGAAAPIYPAKPSGIQGRERFYKTPGSPSFWKKTLFLFSASATNLE
jgi:hypothetical protein